MEEKSTVFMTIVPFMKRRLRSKLIIVINTDFDKAFWEHECEKLKVYIESIEYTSIKEQDEIAYNMYLGWIPNLTIEGIRIATKEDLDKYWSTGKRRNILARLG